MKRFGTHVEEAIAHEAGHIVVGTIFGIKLHRLGFEVVLRDDGEEPYVKQFATTALQPPDNEISSLPDPVKKALVFFIAGGLAGQVYAKLMESGDGLGADKTNLAKYNPDKTLEEIAQMMQPTIHKNRRVFRRLRSLIKHRFEAVMQNIPGIQSGYHLLLTEEEIRKTFEKEKLTAQLEPEPPPGNQV